MAQLPIFIIYQYLLEEKKSVTDWFLLILIKVGLVLIAEKYKINKIYENVKDVVEVADAAIIATPPATHFSISKQFLEAKKSVLCEKPLTESFLRQKISKQG